MAEWTWEPDDFAALWYRDAIDRFPRPLRYISRFQTEGAYEAHRAEVRARLSSDEREQFELLVHTLTNPQLRISLVGGSNATNKGAVREYRVVGARSAHYGVLLAQAWVDGVDGPIRGRLFGPEQLPMRLVNTLPPCEPGSHAPATFHVRDLGSQDGQQSFAHRSPREQYARLVRRPAEGGGSTQLLTGSILDRPDPLYIAQWYDIAGDGRYLEERTGDHVSVRPATPRDIAAHFTTWITRTLQRANEEQHDNW